MERIGIRELRQHASRYLDRVKAGESVEVTERGELVALLVPPGPATTARERLIAEGRLLPGAGGLGDLPEPRTPPRGAPDAQEVLEELRADRP